MQPLTDTWESRCKTSLWRNPMCTLQKRLPRAHISMLHDKEVSSVTFWVVLSYSSIPSVFYASLHAVWGLHSGDEVLNFCWIYWLLFFRLCGFFFFQKYTKSKRVQKTLKTCPSLQNHFTQCWELPGPRTRVFVQAHQIHHPIEIKVPMLEYASAK